MSHNKARIFRSILKNRKITKEKCIDFQNSLQNCSKYTAYTALFFHNVFWKFTYILTIFVRRIDHKKVWCIVRQLGILSNKYDVRCFSIWKFRQNSLAFFIRLSHKSKRQLFFSFWPSHSKSFRFVGCIAFLAWFIRELSEFQPLFWGA